EYVYGRALCFSAETNVTCQAAAFPGTFFTSGRLMLVMRSPCTSGSQPRAVVYMRKKAVLPLMGSGGASGAFSATFCGASEQAQKIATETVVNKKRDFIAGDSIEQIPVYRARINSD